MKLVELLARELSVWPERTVKVDQSHIDYEVYAYDGAHNLTQTGVFLSRLADNPDEYVTQEEWEGECAIVPHVPPAVITLTPAEVSSGYDRAQWAEGLIRQLPEDHEGRNSWLMNYGDPVQRAADEREKEVHEMLPLIRGLDRTPVDIAFALHDAGYRKP